MKEINKIYDTSNWLKKTCAGNKSMYVDHGKSTSVNVSYLVTIPRYK